MAQGRAMIPKYKNLLKKLVLKAEVSSMNPQADLEVHALQLLYIIKSLKQVKKVFKFMRPL